MGDYRRAVVGVDALCGPVRPGDEPTESVVRTKLQRRVRFYRKRREPRNKVVASTRDATFLEDPIGWVMYFFFGGFVFRPYVEIGVLMPDEPAEVIDSWDEWVDVT